MPNYPKAADIPYRNNIREEKGTVLIDSDYT